MQRLESAWSGGPDNSPRSILAKVLKKDEMDSLDDFDAVQLAHCINVCRRSASLSDAGRNLFGASRTKRSSTNDAGRIRKYLLRWGLDYDTQKTEHA